MGTLNLSLIIRTIDRASAPMRKIKAAISSLADNRGLKALTGYANAGGRALGYAANKARDLAKWAGAALGAGMVALGFSVFRTGAQFERFQIILENTEGSSAKAKAAMGWVKKFAEETPYELARVMDAFVKLRAYGIDPTDGTLRTLGDTASGMGKDLIDAVEALADAQTGEFERLKEFGIRGSQAGSKVRFAFVKDGKEMVVTVRKNAADIRKALLGIWNDKFGGQMAKQSKGLTGMLSNIADWWSGFEQMIGEAGVFDFVKGEVAGFLDSLKTPEGLAAAQALAKNISDGMIKGIKTLKDVAGKVNFGKLIADIAALVGFGAQVIAFFGGFAGAVNALVSVGIAKLGFDIGALAVGVGAIFGIAAAPIALVVGAVTALAIGAFLLWRNWDKVSAWVGNAVVGMAIAIVKAWRATAAFFTGFWARVSGAFKAGVAAIWNALPGWMRTLLTGIGKGVSFTFKLLGGQPPTGGASRPGGPPRGPGPAMPAMPRLGPPRAAAKGVGLPGFQRQSWDGKLTVELQGDQAARVRSVRSSSNDFDLLVDRGLNLGVA